MVYGKHLGLKGIGQAPARRGRPQARQAGSGDRRAQRRSARQGALKARAVWRFFPARSGRQPRHPARPARRASPSPPGTSRARTGTGGLSLADYVLPGDHVALFVTTAGEGVAKGWRPGSTRASISRATPSRPWLWRPPKPPPNGSTPACAQRWGFPDADDLPLEDKLAARYRGKRYSFGYPACPDLAFQRELFHALQPEEIGVHLTEGDMMDPEASVSALVFHHPDARYFGV